ncbi:MAG TPA: ATP-dependent DNA helicase [Candidatus Paceibacterota bacterium]
MKSALFETEYKKLNKEQKDAVDTLSGPVMVVAGPGTGKTQVLALRIANILTKTDIKPDGVLCLTFTKSAVGEMTKRLVRYIGEAGEKVNVSTFHSFGMKIIEKYFSVLGMPSVPKLLEETDVAVFFHEILEGNDWKYLRPRGEATRYYKDLRTLMSLLAREQIGKEDFLSEVESEIKSLTESEESMSTRGESKGKLKKEVMTKLGSLERTREVAKFMEVYGEVKKEKNVLDYDDVLTSLVKIVEVSEDAAADIREAYLYVLVDEHQDSSRVQNEFLKSVWGPLESPDIFVVGDDRQLIYGFSGASIEHFAGFKKSFPGAKLITLVNNYRSTQVILDAAHALLQSVMSDKKLISQSKDSHPIRLIEAGNPEAEIIACAADIKLKIENGKLKIDDCAVLVPKNVQARQALGILHHEGLPVSSGEGLNLFDQEETQAFLHILKILSTGDTNALALSILDKYSGIPPLEAHAFFAGRNMREFSLTSFLQESAPSLFTNSVESWKNKISKWLKDKEKSDLPSLIKTIGEELFAAPSEQELVSGKEITDTILDLLTKQIEKNSQLTLPQFATYLERLETYGDEVPIIVGEKGGVKVLTMHSSKGREFDYVWIAHMDEWSLSGGRRGGFALPESIAGRVEERDVDAIKRKLYVAITRAKRFCTLSYATYSHREFEQALARVITELPEEVFVKQPARDASHSDAGGKAKLNTLPELKKLTRAKYAERYVSASLLNNFFECAWKWYFQNLLQLPTPPAESLEFGIAMHAVVDQILKMPKAPSDTELGELIREVVARGRGDDKARARAGREIENVLQAWVKNRLPEIKLARKTEESISATDKRFPHLKIYGKIDLIENLDKKEVRVTDFKTGSLRKKSDIEKLDDEGRMSGNLRQLAMYSYLLRNNPKWATDARESRLEFLETKNPKETFYDRVITTEDIDLLVQDIADYDNLVKSGEWINRECHFNSYGKAGAVCEYCELAKVLWV